MMALPFFGRRKPYTERGISRVPCARCGAPSYSQWQACANGRRHVGICAECDIGLNELALEFMNIPNREKLVEAYTIKTLSDLGGC